MAVYAAPAPAPVYSAPAPAAEPAAASYGEAVVVEEPAPVAGEEAAAPAYAAPVVVVQGRADETEERSPLEEAPADEDNAPTTEEPAPDARTVEESQTVEAKCISGRGIDGDADEEEAEDPCVFG